MNAPEKQSAAVRMFQRAVADHQAGRFAEAEKNYREVLALQPRHADALHLLGVISSQRGLYDLGIKMIQDAISLNPQIPDYHYSLGNALGAKGMPGEAVHAFHTATRLKPNYFEAYINLGNAFRAQGNNNDAIRAYRQAVMIRPEFAEAHYNLAVALRDEGLIDEAIVVLNRTIELKPNYAEAYNSLGVALSDKGQYLDAIDAHERALRVNPKYTEAYNNLGVAYSSLRQYDQAMIAYRHAIQCDPVFLEAQINLGNALHSQGLLDQAISIFDKAAQQYPRSPEIYYNLAVAMHDSGRYEQAIRACHTALTLNNNYAQAHYTLGSLLLLLGEFERGWAEYEWRWKWKEFPSKRRELMEPRWEGEELTGRTIFLYAEQGLGDTVQFVRYVPMVAARGGKIVMECPPQLAQLLHEFGVWSKPSGSRPKCDYQCPLLGLPKIFRTDLQSIPHEVPYLHVDQQLSGRWGERVGVYGSETKVGIVWAGNPANTNDHNRSIPLSQFFPLAKLSGIKLFSLQKGKSASTHSEATEKMGLIDYTSELNDFADTAALINNLDLIITVNTAMAHLAGALGKRVWVLLTYVPDWRWLLEREDSPWYPTMRLFRQKTRGDWSEVIERVANALGNFCSDRSQAARR